MGITAENLAEKYDISREVSFNCRISFFIANLMLTPCAHMICLLYLKDCDKLAIRSQQTWGEAKKNGVFDLEMAPVEIETKKGTKVRGILFPVKTQECISSFWNSSLTEIDAQYRDTF